MNKNDKENKKDFFSEKNIDKEQYPLEFSYILENGCPYLTEKDDSKSYQKKYAPTNDKQSWGLQQISFIATAPITYSLSCGQFESERIYAKAKLWDDRENSISFFGSEKKIKDIGVDIYSSKKQGFQFCAGMARQWDDPFFSDSEEFIEISLFINHKTFKKIVSLWEHNNLERIFFRLKTKYINGLYSDDSGPLGYYYKILEYRELVKNYPEIPDNLLDNNKSIKYFESDDCFELIFRKEKFYCHKDKEDKEEEIHKRKNVDLFNDEETENKRIHLIQDTSKLLLEKIEKVRVYVFWIILLFLLNLFFKYII